MKYPVLKLAIMWDAGIVIGSLTCYSTMLATSFINFLKDIRYYGQLLRSQI